MQGKRRLLAAAMALCAFGGALGAQNSIDSLDVETAVALALENNLGVRSQRLDTKMAERDYAYRLNVLMPQISAQGTLARPNNPPEFQSDPRWEYVAALSEVVTADPTVLLEPLQIPEGEDPPAWSLSGGVSAQLTLAAQMIHGVKAVSDAYNNAEIELADAEREIERDVRTAFYELLLQQEQLELSEQRLAAAEERLEELRENYEAGLVDELTLRQTEVGVANQRPSVLQQRQGLQTARRSLGATIGMPSLDGVAISGSIDAAVGGLASLDELLLLVDENADVRAARRGIEGLETQQRLSRAEMLPSLTLSYSLSPRLSGDPWSDDVWDSENWNDGGSFSVTVRQPLDPLLPGSSTRKDIANRRDQIRQTELRVQQAREGVQLQTIQLAGSAASTERTIASLTRNVQTAERAFELANEAYEAGVRDYSVVRDAEIDLADAQLQLLQAEHQYVELLLELEYLLNTPLEDIKETRE